MRLHRTITLATGLSITFGAQLAAAADPVRLAITIRDHRFEPAQLTAPAGVPIQILVTNADASAEEFESAALGVEKVVAAGRSAVVRLPPQPPGRYPFIGEFHAETAQGSLLITAIP